MGGHLIYWTNYTSPFPSHTHHACTPIYTHTPLASHPFITRYRACALFSPPPPIACSKRTQPLLHKSGMASLVCVSGGVAFAAATHAETPSHLPSLPHGINTHTRTYWVLSRQPKSLYAASLALQPRSHQKQDSTSPGNSKYPVLVCITPAPYAMMGPNAILHPSSAGDHTPKV